MARAMSAMGPHAKHAASTKLCKQLWQADGPLEQASSGRGLLLGFLPLGDEIDPTPAMQRWLDAGGQVAVPVCDWQASTMQACCVASLADEYFDVGRYGIREPKALQIVPADALAVVLVPGVAFDADGGRLGRGGGFYDRFLQHVSASCVTVGVCVAGQVVESVPREPHDVRVSHVLAG
jgi:5-formyltetrahydrofolate cyclo-ligase